MSVLSGPLFALAALLAAAGVLKVAQPAAAVAALRTAGLPGPEPAVRVLGGAEILLAAVAIAFGGRLAALAVAVAYGGFAWFSRRVLTRSEATASCGCFGVDSSSPVSTWHVGVNVVATLVALAAVAWPSWGLLEVLGEQPLGGVPFVVLTALCTWLLLATYTLLPDLFDAVDEVRAQQAAETAS